VADEGNMVEWSEDEGHIFGVQYSVVSVQCLAILQMIDC
jgi:hypothetical protein